MLDILPPGIVKVIAQIMAVTAVTSITIAGALLVEPFWPNIRLAVLARYSNNAGRTLYLSEVRGKKLGLDWDLEIIRIQFLKIKNRLGVVNYQRLRSGAAAILLILMSSWAAAGPGSFALYLLIGFSALKFPGFLLKVAGGTRARALLRELPYFIDLLRIYNNSGLTLNRALRVSSNLVPGPLGDELAKLVGELELSPDLPGALYRFARRLGLPQVDAFVEALVQEAISGMKGLDEILRLQAEHTRNAWVAAARKNARLRPLMLTVVPGMLVTSVLILFSLPPFIQILITYGAD